MKVKIRSKGDLSSDFLSITQPFDSSPVIPPPALINRVYGTGWLSTWFSLHRFHFVIEFSASYKRRLTGERASCISVIWFKEFSGFMSYFQTLWSTDLHSFMNHAITTFVSVSFLLYGLCIVNIAKYLWQSDDVNIWTAAYSPITSEIPWISDHLFCPW
jgi:hypothetical protein